MRAFGLLLRDMVDFLTPPMVDPAWPYLSALADVCALAPPAARPRFAAIQRALASLRDEGVAAASKELAL